MPSSIRPPEMSSTWATAMAVIDGCRKVADVTSVPSRMSGTWAAIAPRLTKDSDGPGSPERSPIDNTWSERKKAEKPPSRVALATASRSAWEAPCWGSVKMRRSMTRQGNQGAGPPCGRLLHREGPALDSLAAGLVAEPAAACRHLPGPIGPHRGQRSRCLADDV